MLKETTRPMPTSLEVLFTPAEFAALERRDLSGAVCVVFDVLRATSSMVTALANGAAAIVPVAEISEALQCRQRDTGVLLAGVSRSRNGRRLLANPDLREDVTFCVQRDLFSIVAELARDGSITDSRQPQL